MKLIKKTLYQSTPQHLTIDLRQCNFLIYLPVASYFLFYLLNMFIHQTQKICVRKGRERQTKARNFSLSCWEEKESCISLADTPFNLIHYSVVMLLSPHAGNWDSCRDLKYPEGEKASTAAGKRIQLLYIFSGLSLNCKMPLPQFLTIFIKWLGDIRWKLQSSLNQAHWVFEGRPAVWTDAMHYTVGYLSLSL